MDSTWPDISWDEDDVHNEHDENDKGGDTKKPSFQNVFFQNVNLAIAKCISMVGVNSVIGFYTKQPIEMNTKWPDISWDEDNAHDEHDENDKGGDTRKPMSPKIFFENVYLAIANTHFLGRC